MYRELLQLDAFWYLKFLGLFREAEGRWVRVLAQAYMHITYTYVYIYGPQVQRPVQCTKPAEGATLRMARRPRLPTIDAWITRLTPSFAGSRKQTDIFGRCTCMYKVSTRLYDCHRKRTVCICICMYVKRTICICICMYV